MARLPRLVLPGHPHLVIQRARPGETIFADEADCREYLNALRAALAETPAALHGYCLLAGEARLLATPASAGDLARLVQNAGRRHVRSLNARLMRRGSPWDGRFRSALVEASACFVETLRFAEGDGEEPLASSRAHHAGATPDPLITDHPVFWGLGNTPFEREGAYRRALEHPLDARRREQIRAAVLRGMPIGSEAFLRAAAALTGRRTTLATRGRPRRRSA